MNPDITSDINLGVRSTQRGSMLLSVLFIMLVLAALMAGLATLSSQSSRQLVYEVQAFKARLAAESVLEQKVFELLGDSNSSAAVTTEVAGCAGIARVPESSTDAGVTQVNVIATGTCNTGQLTVIRNIEVEVIE
ncbi:Tfp pilus assembly protein PilX [Oceanisphaera litoralis]|uniref:hypothetical protein n=1 Tax=Oceanisphaera litoralis TaxID=225144 RepID=UPI001EF87C64|nr:hypothetical protein [Oceanisphaera litoralis]MBM7454757.1 Tfp pilus assembly protein PilX [Oceanisphaera litoralis]